MQDKVEFKQNASLFRKSDLAGIVGALLGGGLVWLAILAIFDIPEYLLPSPSEVAAASVDSKSRLGLDFLVTGLEALAGFVISTVASLALAIAMSLYRSFEKAAFPVLIVVKSMPVVALAPLVGFWFGYGYGGKVFVAALISFFPLVVNSVSGMRAVSDEQLDFFRVSNASKWDEVIKLQLPSALPAIFSAMRIAGPLAVVGAVVAEMLGARHGLGSTLAISSMTLNIPLNFAALFASALLGLLIYNAILLVERATLRRYRLSPSSEW